MSKGLLFSGQGAQFVGMGKSLYEESELSKEVYRKADEILGWPLTEYCFEGPEETLTETRVCQPALYVHGYAVYNELKAAGKTTDATYALGLSLGELTALAVAEAISFEDGLKVVAERGRLMQLACDATDGTMASVIGGDKESVGALCESHDIDMANLNCPGQIVMSGERAKVGAAVKEAKESGNYRMVVPLKVAGAYHSRLMESARVEFAKFLESVEFQAPKMTVLTNTTGNAVSTPEDIREALAKQVVSSVLWEDCMRTAAGAGLSDFIECGVGGVLAGLAKRTDRSWKVTSVAEFADLAKI